MVAIDNSFAVSSASTTKRSTVPRSAARTIRSRRRRNGCASTGIAAVDAAIGEFVDALETLGLLDQTALVVTADHGGEFWDHGQFEHGHDYYAEVTRIPLVF